MKTYDYKDETKDVKAKVILTRSKFNNTQFLTDW